MLLLLFYNYNYFIIITITINFIIIIIIIIILIGYPYCSFEYNVFSLFHIDTNSWAPIGPHVHEPCVKLCILFLLSLFICKYSKQLFLVSSRVSVEEVLLQPEGHFL